MIDVLAIRLSAAVMGFNVDHDTLNIYPKEENHGGNKRECI